MSSVAKCIEVIAESEESFDDAVENAIEEASETVSNIKSLWVENMSVIVEENEIQKYRVNAKITFVIKEGGAWFRIR